MRTHNPLYVSWSKNRRILLYASTKKAIKKMREDINEFLGDIEWEKIKELKRGKLATLRINGETIHFEEAFDEPTTYYQSRLCPYKGDPTRCPYKNYHRCKFVWWDCPYRYHTITYYTTIISD